MNVSSPFAQRAALRLGVASTAAAALLGCIGGDPPSPPPASPPQSPSPSSRVIQDESPGALVSRVFESLAAGQPVDIEERAGSRLRNALENSAVHSGLWIGQPKVGTVELEAIARHADHQFWVNYTVDGEPKKALWTFDPRGGLTEISFGPAVLSMDILGGPHRPFQKATLCRPAETHIATCGVTGAKQASICSTAGTLRYRFGRPNQIEMSLPAHGTQPVTSSHRTQGPETVVQQVHARVNRTAYTFVVSNGEGEISGRVTVREDGQELATLQCSTLDRSGDIPVVDMDPLDPRAWAGVWGFDGPVFIESEGRLTMRSPKETQPVKQVKHQGVVLGTTDCSLEFELHPDHRITVEAPEGCRITPAFEGVFDRIP